MNSKYLLGFLSLIGVYVLFLVCFETLKERDEFRDNNNLNSKQHRSSFRIREGPEEVNKTITTTRMETQPKYFSVDYEVFGKVQGVYFRKYTQEKAAELGLTGWVQNTKSKTVVGTIQGNRDKITEMKDWLCNKGSPSSKIERCAFNNERNIEKLEYSEFSRKE